MDLDNPPNPAGDHTLRFAALVCAMLLALAALSVTRSVMTSWPSRSSSSRSSGHCNGNERRACRSWRAVRNRRWLLLIVWGFGRIAQWVFANSARLQGLYTHAADLLEQRGLYAAELIAQQFNMSWIVGVVRGIGGSLQGIVSFALVTFIFVILGLLELEPLGRHLRWVGDGSFGVTAVDAAAEIAGSYRLTCSCVLA